MVEVTEAKYIFEFAIKYNFTFLKHSPCCLGNKSNKTAGILFVNKDHNKNKVPTFLTKQTSHDLLFIKNI